MDTLQLWIEGYKLRGEACKQGGIVSAILVAILGGTNNAFPCNPIAIYAITVLVVGIGLSALAFLFLGWAITDAGSKLVEYNVMDSRLQAEKAKVKLKILWANIFGFAQLFCLIFGLFLTILVFLRKDC